MHKINSCKEVIILVTPFVLTMLGDDHQEVSGGNQGFL